MARKTNGFGYVAIRLHNDFIISWANDSRKGKNLQKTLPPDIIRKLYKLKRNRPGKKRKYSRERSGVWRANTVRPYGKALYHKQKQHPKYAGCSEEKNDIHRLPTAKRWPVRIAQKARQLFIPGAERIKRGSPNYPQRSSIRCGSHKKTPSEESVMIRWLG